LETDYRQLCIELFGTDNADEIRKIVKAKNVRGAGRKKKFTDEDVNEIRELRSHGVSINDIAERYNTSRQVISKYISVPPAEGIDMRMTYMFYQSPCTVINIDSTNKKIFIENYTDDYVRRAFGINENPSWKDFEKFLEYRCFDRTCGCMDAILSDLHLDSYDPLQIVQITKGRTTDDNMWIKTQKY